MRPREVVTGDRGVSPVIGVILMVAITVVLASVVGVLVFGIGQQQTEAPTATFSFAAYEESSNPDEVRIVHESGDTIDNAKLYVSIDPGVQPAPGPPPGPSNRLSWADLGDGGDVVESGDSVLAEPPDTDGDLEDKTVRVVWIDGGTSVVVAEWDPTVQSGSPP